MWIPSLITPRSLFIFCLISTLNLKLSAHCSCFELVANIWLEFLQIVLMKILLETLSCIFGRLLLGCFFCFFFFNLLYICLFLQWVFQTFSVILELLNPSHPNTISIFSLYTKEIEVIMCDFYHFLPLSGPWNRCCSVRPAVPQRSGLCHCPSIWYLFGFAMPSSLIFSFSDFML